MTLMTALFLLLSLPSSPAYAEESHPGMSSEALYSEAVLAFNRKQMGEAVKILDQILAESPRHLEALELKALTLKTMGDERQAIQTYQQLIQNKPEKERGPYHFELGAMLHKNKKIEPAKFHFQRAVDLGFNEIAARLFLGTIYFSQGDTNAAKGHFVVIRARGSAEYKAVAAYYLGMIHLKNGYAAGGTSEMMAARNFAAEAGPSSKLAQDIQAAAQKVLKPFDSSQTFGSITLLGQYDSNITQSPSGTGTSSVSNKATTNILFNGGLGYMTSPASSVQAVFSYRLSLNKVTDSQLSSYNFVTNTPAVYLNFSPLSETNGGLKAEGTFMFQNGSPTGDSTNTTYMKYMGGVEVGPYFKTELSQGWFVQIEADAKPQTFYQSSDLTGTLLEGKASVKGSSASAYFNPTFSVSYGKNNAQGSDWKNQSLTLSGLNTARLGKKDNLSFNVDYAMTSYPESSTNRSDKNLSARASFIHNLSEKWSLLADFSFTKNTSSLESVYSYSRWSSSVGMGWSL